MIRVVIADDQPLVRLGLRVLLETEDDLTLVGEAENGQAAVDMVRATRPDVVLLDIRMPVLDGLAALRAIVAEPALAATRVIIVTTFEVDEYVFEALRSGASGFLLKDAEPADLLRAVRVVAAGESLLSPSVTRLVIDTFARRPTLDAPDLRSLTEREREVMGLVGRGLSNDEIAARLVISPATARTHVSRVMVKLAARDRAQLAVLAHQSGLG
ncbi:response regulator transcription factor [Frankia sp. Ag45/Mut15]|uniref:Response regulator transcription factor n=1 Tax=Frankia umida TaxID=573489 RepID=A0ABT0JVM4_9ACTN|nr:response regulator transcription factor [Frankia umida]MCK9875593.1 response regulator transcription factor [Frankia umida]